MLGTLAAKQSLAEGVLELRADLTWEELRQWAGAKVVARGKSCWSTVEDLRQASA